MIKLFNLQNHWKAFQESRAEKFTPSQVDATVDGNNLISYSSLLKISWVRQKDLHIISAGPFVYTSDERFEPKHVDHTDEWYLHIKYVQTADTGTYECQISTEPKMSLPFYLNVIEAKSEILGGPSTYYQSKDTINLTCIINQTASPPLFVYWFKDNQVLGFLSQTVNPSDSRIRVSTIKGPISISTLEITNARSSDSGNYSCRPVPQYVDPANITVNVLNGDNPAAMQHSNHHKDQVTSHTLLMVVLIMVSWSCWSGLCQSTLTVQGETVMEVLVAVSVYWWQS
uniref:Ig-like domain-containing protein n=1 Tax=Tetranychus urticae TaxID=32264 RepID=T1KUW2_TETUR